MLLPFLRPPHSSSLSPRGHFVCCIYRRRTTFIITIARSHNVFCWHRFVALPLKSSSVPTWSRVPRGLKLFVVDDDDDDGCLSCTDCLTLSSEKLFTLRTTTAASTIMTVEDWRSTDAPPPGSSTSTWPSTIPSTKFKAGPSRKSSSRSSELSALEGPLRC